MRHNLILTGDINLLGVTDPAVPFAQVQDRLRAADVAFANLECCFYEPEGARSPEDEGFYAPLKAAKALTIAGIHAVGNANNVNYGAPAIRSSLARQDELGIQHTGAGVNSVEARKPVILERDGVRFGFLQRTSVYWSHGHEATANYPGVATILDLLDLLDLLITSPLLDEGHLGKYCHHRRRPWGCCRTFAPWDSYSHPASRSAAATCHRCSYPDSRAPIGERPAYLDYAHR